MLPVNRRASNPVPTARTPATAPAAGAGTPPQAAATPTQQKPVERFDAAKMSLPCACAGGGNESALPAGRGRAAPGADGPGTIGVIVRRALSMLALVACGACGSGIGVLGKTDARADTRAENDARGDSEAVAPAPPDGGHAPTGSCPLATIYAAPDGDGTDCSCAAPCALETARDRARDLAPTVDGDVVVLLRGGTYALGHTFTLDASHSGVNGHAVVYRAAPGERPVISGGRRVSGFVPDATHAGVFAAPVPAGSRSRQLFVNGRRATRSRGPAPAGAEKTATGFKLANPAIAAWPDRGTLEVVGTNAWKMFRCPVAAVTTAGITVAEPCWNASQAPEHAGRTFDTIGSLENALELLDQPGEFYLDEGAGRLYYAPRQGEDLASAEVVLPVVEELLRAEGTPAAPLVDVVFEGLGFAHATWLGPSTSDGYVSLQASITRRGSPRVATKPPAAVTFRATHGVRLTNCRFEHLGAVGLAFEHGAQGNIVERSWFVDLSGSAVMIGDVTHEEDHHPSSPALVVSDNALRASYVTRAGVEYLDSAGVLVGYTTRTTIEQNELFDLPYTGVSVGWGWGFVDPGGSRGYKTPSTSRGNVIRRNVIGHHMRLLRDGGGIYTLGAQPDSVIEGNVLSNQAAPYGVIYLDNGTQGYTVTNNLVLIDAKQDLGTPTDPDRAYWLHVQGYDPVASNNTVGVNFVNDPTLAPTAPTNPRPPMDPSNTVATPTVVGADLSPAAAIIAAAGTRLRSAEVGAGRPATASSVYDPGHAVAQGNNGNAFDGWSPTGADPHPLWQVDLEGTVLVDAVEVVSRWAIDQPITRRSFRVVAADEPSFAAPVVLGEVDAAGAPHRAITAFTVSPPLAARYVRVEKTAAEYFFLAEVLVHGIRR